MFWTSLSFTVFDQILIKQNANTNKKNQRVEDNIKYWPVAGRSFPRPRICPNSRKVVVKSLPQAGSRHLFPFGETRRSKPSSEREDYYDFLKPPRVDIIWNYRTDDLKYSVQIIVTYVRRRTGQIFALRRKESIHFQDFLRRSGGVHPLFGWCLWWRQNFAHPAFRRYAIVNMMSCSCFVENRYCCFSFTERYIM